MLVALVLVPVVRAQPVENGSFERAGEFSLEGWQFTYGPQSAEAFAEVPPHGGAWSLKVDVRNVQAGCGNAANVASQVIPQVRNGDIWRLTAWARTPAQHPGPPRIYWTTFDSSSTTGQCFLPGPAGPVDTTSSDTWVLLSVVDTLDIAESDSVGIVLDPGSTTGIELETDITYFDLVAVEKIGEVPSSSERSEKVPGAKLVPNAPNPFQGTTTIAFSLDHATHVSLAVYDVAGREVRRLVERYMPAGSHEVRFEGSKLARGVYVYRLTTSEGAWSRSMLLQ